MLNCNHDFENSSHLHLPFCVLGLNSSYKWVIQKREREKESGEKQKEE